MLDQFIVRCECCQAEVCYADLIVLLLFNALDQYVIKFDVSMYDLLLLEEVKSEQ